ACDGVAYRARRRTRTASCDPARHGVEGRARLGVVAHVANVLQLAQLGDDLLEACIVGDLEQDDALRAVTDRHAEDALDVECAAGGTTPPARHSRPDDAVPD